MINYLDGLRDMTKYKELYDELCKSQDIQKEKERDEQFKLKEKNKKDEYLKAFANKNLKWWQRKLSK